MKERSFLLLHGFQGSGSEHWQTWLSGQLTERGEKVYYPNLPNEHAPIQGDWLEALYAVLEDIPEHEEVTVVTHSLGCILWLHYASVCPKRKVQRAILVAPPSPFCQHEVLSTFFPAPLHGEKIAGAAEQTVIIHSSTDHYCSLHDAVHYMNIGVPNIVLPHMGHINTESGYGPWPFILEACLHNRFQV